MAAQTLQCPFCSTTSTRGTGLTAHIRGRHPNEYSKWVKDPNRLQAALKAATSKKPAKSARAIAAESFVCPDCGKTFKTQGALGGHRAYLHKRAPKKASEPASPQLVGAMASGNAPKKGGEAPKPPTSALAHPVFSTPSLNSAHEHLRAAREALLGRHQQIEDELKRVAELQAENERVQRELEAVNVALQVFGDNTK